MFVIVIDEKLFLCHFIENHGCGSKGTNWISYVNIFYSTFSLQVVIEATNSKSSVFYVHSQFE